MTDDGKGKINREFFCLFEFLDLGRVNLLIIDSGVSVANYYAFF